MGCFNLNISTGNSITDNKSNPDIRNFKIVKYDTIGKYTVIKVVYPNCTNFEGNKIMVYKDIKIETLLIKRELDPHFFRGNSSPIARFKPDSDGWGSAKAFCRLMSDPYGFI